MQFNHIPSTRARPDPTWKILAEFSLPSQPGSDHLACEQVAAAVQALKLSPADLERLKTAVAEAALNAINCGGYYYSQPNAPILIRVLVVEQANPMHQTDPGSGPLPDPQIPSPAAQVSSQQSPRSWGFFLIRRKAEEGYIRLDGAHHTIELFLYRESN
jgi:anti-sigma regulatory factor (Ser/Thr protein kinase)